MKKIVVMLIVLVLAMNVSFADDVEKIIEDMNKTNLEIDKTIFEAVEKSEDVVTTTEEDIQKLIIGDKVLSSEEKVTKIISEIELIEDEKDKEKALEKLEKEQEKLEKERAKHNESFSKNYEKHMERLSEYEAKKLEKIDKLVQKLLDETNEMSLKLRTEAAKKGVIIVCDWIPVEINGQVIMVDPLRVFSVHRR